MKSRSNNRLQTSDPPDDWVNGSWTVDCICGVTFDDGEEMVNCDECGVWVHTRCFRFAKGEKSFACDKCKNKVSNSNNNNDSEETEVAQLLVELPTKTIKMSTSNNNSNIHGSFYQSNVSNRSSNSNVFAYSNSTPPLPPRRPPQQMWVKPMEERVHVQGVPGGGDDSSLFKGFPIAFASELWKCSGYIPKKFNFRYREFPCWDNEVEVEVEAKGADGGCENVVDKGAGVLYSLSKENVVGKGDQGRSGGLDRKGLKDRKLSSGDLKKSSMVCFSKEKGMSRQNLAKRSRDELGSSKDRSEKKKIKVSPREDSKKDKGHGFKTVIVQSISARQAEVSESKAHKVASNAHLADGSIVEKIKTNTATDEGNSLLRSFEVYEPAGSSKKEVKAEKPSLDAVDISQKSAITETVALLNTEKDTFAKNSLKKEDAVLETMNNSQALLSKCQSSDVSKSKTLTIDMDIAAIERNEAEVVKDVETNLSVTSKAKSDTNVDNSKGGMRSLPDNIDVELDSDGMKLCTERVSSPDRDCKDSKPNEIVAASSHEDQDDSKTSEAPTDSQLVKDEGIADNQCNNKVKGEGSENPVDVQRASLGSKEAAKVTGKVTKLSEEKLPPPSCHHKAACVGNLSASSSTIVNSRSSLSDKKKAGTSQHPSSTPKRTLSNSSMLIKKENASRVQVKDEDKYEKTKNIVKDHSKSSSTMKASQSTKTGASPVLKHHISLAKDMRHPSSKKTSVELSSGNDEPAGSQLTQQGSNGQNKSTSGNRGDKALQSNLQSSSKSSQFCHPPPSSIAPAGLSDEELALLLHQELNSSPRVPRVPRVRHTGSLPQISSPSATSIFIKRSTSSGGKEQQTFSRRKNKDGSRRSRDQDGEVRKSDRAPSSPDSVKTTDAEAEGASESIHSVRKNAEDISTSTHSGPSSSDANELKSSSIRGSPNNNPEDDTGTNKGQAPPIHRTLPGLIAEIMGEGRRMTYEELCNAVLPHWQNLRKHNGEKYAYSSHSQAVLDCLRNRSEWSRLVDRGPKTNASRKKRKIDVEPPNTESEDGGYRTRRAGKSKSFESNKEEFPKGRRNARKRRRLALRGRGVGDDRKRTKVEVRSEDSASFSDSSEDTGTSEDDSQESGMCVAKSEVSASSADTAAR